MKKALSLILVILMTLSLLVLAGCDNDKEGQSGTTTTTTAGSITVTTTQNNGGSRTTTTTTTATEGTEQSTTTTTRADNTTTTTTRKETTTEKQDDDSGVRGVLNKQRTEKVRIYEIDEATYEIGAKKERTITYKGTIKVGNISGISGSKYASVDVPFTIGMEAYINTINYDGGIGGDYDSGVQGYYIEVISRCDGGDYAPNALAYTRKLVDEERVFAIINQGEAAINGSVIDYVKQSGVIACYFSSSSELFNTDAYSVRTGSTIFPMAPISTPEGRIIAGRLLKDHPEVKTVGIVYTPDDIGKGIRDGAKAQVECMGEGYSAVLCEVTSANNLDFAINRLANCDAVIIAADQSITINILKAMISNGIYVPVSLSHNMAASYILTSIQSKYKALAAEDRFPIYSNFWLSPTDVAGYLEFAESVLSYMGNNEYIASTNAMYGWMAANVFCEGLERIVEAGKEITIASYVEAMESAPIKLPMCTSASGDTLLDYSDGVRIGVIRLGFLKTNQSCNAFEEAVSLQSYINLLKTGNIIDID